MTKTEAIIWKRIQEKAERMASQETLHSFTEREAKCWDAHCYKYINAYGKVNYLLSQEEFEKFKFVVGLKRTAYEILYRNNRKLPADLEALLSLLFSLHTMNFEIIENMYIIPPMWDDREKST